MPVFIGVSESLKALKALKEKLNYLQGALYFA